MDDVRRPGNRYSPSLKIAPSSKGKTRDFGSRNPRSNRGGATKFNNNTMSVYTRIVPPALAKDQQIIGFPQSAKGPWYLTDGRLNKWTYRPLFADCTAPTYAEVLDWFIKQRIYINLRCQFEGTETRWSWQIVTLMNREDGDLCPTFGGATGAADIAIESAFKYLPK